MFQGERIPLVNPQRGIFKPRQMRYLLSIKTVIPKPGGRVWYDDQLEAHGQIYDGDDGSTMRSWGAIRTLPTTNGFEQHTRTRSG